MNKEKVNVNEANEKAKAKEVKAEETVPTATEPENLEISVPDDMSDEAFARLEALVSSKRSVLMKALEADELKIIREDKKLKFPWFKLHGIEGEKVAYMQLVTAMIAFAKDATRIDPTEKEVTNEKFVMRNFTIRLGLKGDEYKLLRKLLSNHLTGNSAWSKGTPPERLKAKAATKEVANTKPADDKSADTKVEAVADEVGEKKSSKTTAKAKAESKDKGGSTL